jgi:hypothetical protein
MIVAVGVAACGQGEGDDEREHAGGQALETESAEADTPAATGCQSGDTEICHVTLGRHNNVLSCYVGVRTCALGKWSECADGVVENFYDPGEELVVEAEDLDHKKWKSLSGGPVDCKTNPCDPTCKDFDEKPGPQQWKVQGDELTYKWKQGNKSNLSDDVYKKLFKEPCQIGSDCQSNHYCYDPNSGSCSHEVCATGKGLVSGCSKCVTAICKAKPECCEKKYAGTCEHEPCVEGTGLKPECDPLVKKTCEWDKTCCPYSETKQVCKWEKQAYSCKKTYNCWSWQPCQKTYQCGWIGCYKWLYQCWQESYKCQKSKTVCGYKWTNVYTCGYKWVWKNVYTCGYKWLWKNVYTCGYKWVWKYSCWWQNQYKCGNKWLWKCGNKKATKCGWKTAQKCGWKNAKTCGWKNAQKCGWKNAKTCGYKTYTQCGWKKFKYCYWSCGWGWWGWSCKYKCYSYWSYSCWNNYKYTCWWYSYYSCWWYSYYSCWWYSYYSCWWYNFYSCWSYWYYTCWWNWQYSCWWQNVYTCGNKWIWSYTCWWQYKWVWSYTCWWQYKWVWSYTCWWQWKWVWKCWTEWYWTTCYKTKCGYKWVWVTQCKPKWCTYWTKCLMWGPYCSYWTTCYKDVWVCKNVTTNYPGKWGAQCVNQYKKVGGTCPSSWAGDWNQSCVDAVWSVCGAFCKTPPSGKGQCTPWDPGQKDDKCKGYSLTVGLTCTNNVPICNHGTDDAPDGITVVHYPKDSGNFGLEQPTNQSGAITCTTKEPIKAGHCINMTDCPGLTEGREIMVNPPGPNQVKECYYGDNWGIYLAGTCGTPPCAGDTITAKLKPVNLFITVDKSGSMGGSRWTNTRKAFNAFFASKDSAGLNVGLEFWPHPSCAQSSSLCDTQTGKDQCANPLVPIGKLIPDPAPIDTQEKLLIDTFNATSPGGMTPAYLAYQGATQWGKNAYAMNKNEAYVVIFVTDGYPNWCGANTQKFVDLAKDAYQNAGVITYGVGIVGANTTMLTQMSQAGGGEAFFIDSNNQIEQKLIAALNKIKGQAVKCDIDLPADQTKYDPWDATVVYKPGSGGQVPLSQVTDKSKCGKGWYFDNNSAPTKIMLCPETCTLVQGDPNGSIQISFGCPGNYKETTHNETYEAKCGPGTTVQWGYFSYDTECPSSTKVVWDMRTATTKAGLANATYTNVATAQLVPTDTQVCPLSGPAPCPIDIVSKLGSKAYKNSWLELKATLKPNVNKSKAPTVKGWHITYSCPSIE